MTDPLGQVAFGRNYVSGCWCPARIANVAIRGTPVEIYDKILREKTGDEKGTVDEDTARKAWLEALDRLDRGAVVCDED